MSVLVTGAVGAIGSAVVERFLANGDHVIAQDLDASRYDGREGITAVSGNLLAEDVLAQIETAASISGLTAAVAAHGIAGSNALADCDDAFIGRVLAINWETIPVLYRTIAPALEAAKGTYVIVASQAALGGESENTVYCAAKSAINGWVEAQQARHSDVSFHSLCPGPTDSPLLQAAMVQFAKASGVTPEEYYAGRAKPISLGRYGKPEEMAAAAYYLTRQGARPNVLPVTGGDVLI